MYDIRQFKPTLYLLIVLGLTGFAIAAEQPVLWIFSVAAVILNAWLVVRRKFSPMPRWLSNGITLLASGFVVLQLAGAPEAPILLIGEFLVLLHLVKLFEQRANRDYAQLLVLSLLLMVSAAINTASLLFGVLFIIYLFISLYCCLLFHLKVEADKAKAAQPLPPEKFNAATLRQDQRYLPRSMRRLTVLVSVISLACAVFVFLFFPRGSGAGMLGQMQMKQPEPLTGFNENEDMGLNQVAKITLNTTPVATVQVWHDSKLVTNGSLRLRGVTFEKYGKGANNGEWSWSNEQKSGTVYNASAGEPFFPQNEWTAFPSDRDNWRQLVHLDPIGAKAIFAIGGVRSLTPVRDIKISYWPFDETFQRQDNLNGSIQYEVTSTGSLNSDMALTTHAPQTTGITPELAEFAKMAAGDAAKGRPEASKGIAWSGDEQIARNIERYFQTHFSYTLDLTDSAGLFEGHDPLAVFVTQTKAGHCVLFAGAMTVACQSLGLRARMVAGFVTDEYNSVGQYFQVRQSHAHTWVEVLTTDHGWVTFDPTTGREMPPNESRSTWQRVRHVFDWLESKWAGSVIAYDGETRQNIIQRLDMTLMHSASGGADKVSRWRMQLHGLMRWWEHPRLIDRLWLLSMWTKLLGGAITVMVVILILIIAWYLFEQHRIKRRAVKIGLSSLPIPERMRIARQVGFYENMTELLARRRISKPAHMTPQEFGRSLTFLPTEAFDLIDRLTRVFYRVRYGGANIPQGQQRRLQNVVQRLERAMGE
jgi:transglutaminase-like putative cysteine protease